jgi:hypothetical protein
MAKQKLLSNDYVLVNLALNGGLTCGDECDKYETTATLPDKEMTTGSGRRYAISTPVGSSTFICGAYLEVPTKSCVLYPALPSTVNIIHDRDPDA